MKVKSLSCVRLLATSWTAAYQVPPSMGFFQARVLEWGAIAFSFLRLVTDYLKVKSLSRVRLFVTPCTVASENAMATHSGTLAWKNPMDGEAW